MLFQNHNLNNLMFSPTFVSFSIRFFKGTLENVHVEGFECAVSMHNGGHLLECVPVHVREECLCKVLYSAASMYANWLLIDEEHKL